MRAPCCIAAAPAARVGRSEGEFGDSNFATKIEDLVAASRCLEALAHVVAADVVATLARRKGMPLDNGYPDVLHWRVHESKGGHRDPPAQVTIFGYGVCYRALDIR